MKEKYTALRTINRKINQDRKKKKSNACSAKLKKTADDLIEYIKNLREVNTTHMSAYEAHHLAAHILAFDSLKEYVPKDDDDIQSRKTLQNESKMETYPEEQE